VADAVSQARLLAGRALALEGEEAWSKALADYQQASAMAEAAGCAHLTSLALLLIRSPCSSGYQSICM
jgi:hypothetical protein